MEQKQIPQKDTEMNEASGHLVSQEEEIKTTAASTHDNLTESQQEPTVLMNDLNRF